MALTKATYSMIKGTPFNVLDYGADPTGVNDSLAAIQAAVDAAAPYAQFVTDGIQVYLPAGIYSVSNSINMTLRAGVHLVGAGPKATEIKATSDNPVIRCDGTSVSEVTNSMGISKMTIRGNGKANTNSHGIRLAWTNTCFVQDINMFGCRYGLYLIHNWQTVLSNIRIFGAGTDQSYIGVYMAETDLTAIDNAVNANNVNVQSPEYCGFRIINGQGSKFVNCEAGGGIYGWYVGDPTSGTTKCGWIHFANCLADSTVGAAWLFRRGTASELSEMQLTGCWAGNGEHGFFFDGTTNINLGNAQINGNTLSGVTLNQCRQMVVTASSFRGNNEAANASMADIMLQGGEYHIISGCTCDSNVAGKSIIETALSSANTIYGNNLFQGATIISPFTQIFRNRAFRTENYGLTTIPAGATSVVVNHGLAVTPQLPAISVTPTSDLGAASFFFVNTVTSTTFTIYVDTAPGIDVGFGWNVALSTLQG